MISLRIAGGLTAAICLAALACGCSGHRVPSVVGTPGAHSSSSASAAATPAAPPSTLAPSAPAPGTAGSGATVSHQPPAGPLPIGTGTVESAFNGMCMAVAGNGSANGTKVVVWKCIPGASSQQWTGYSDGTLRINGKCLDVTAASAEIGAKVEIWACIGVASQKWVIGQASYNPFGGITGVGSGNALTDPGSSTMDGTQLEMGVNRGDLSPPWRVSFRHYLSP